jgi:hypothetical protein
LKEKLEELKENVAQILIPESSDIINVNIQTVLEKMEKKKEKLLSLVEYKLLSIIELEDETVIQNENMVVKLEKACSNLYKLFGV